MINDQDHILKNRLCDLIAGRKVKAALFYTFNFDPKFFENYVMPILVSQQTFINNSIANNILWRKLYKDNLVPPITVYFDQDAKSTENGPYLDYKLVPVNLPMVGKNKGNFHPKHSFILVETSEGNNELIVISGSNNLTQPGWCDNIECISEHRMIIGEEFPDEFRRDIKNFIASTHDDFGSVWTEPEKMIDVYLNKNGRTKERTFYFYNSYQSSFQEFLYNYVLKDNSIKLLEIISPYFKKSPELLDIFKKQNIKVRIQAPFKNNYCFTDKAVFEAYKDAGVKWYYPDDANRRTHSKVYRFYGAERVYTIIGSVNLTEPAWNGYAQRPKYIYNIESAVLYVEKTEKPVHLFKNEIQDQRLQFITEQISEENWHERIEIPDISFTVNWLDKSLSWKSKAKNECQLHLSSSQVFSLEGTHTIVLTDLTNGNAIIDGIARKPILRVTERFNAIEYTHFYYVNQIGFECRPLEFRLSASDIIDAWELLGSENAILNDWLVNRLELATNILQDESGKLISDKTADKSLLNEMARFFYGLVKLESYLVNEDVLRRNIGIKSAHFNNIRYYLTNDNVDTLYSYFKDLCKLHAGGNMMSVYYWLILNIIVMNFYENKLLWKIIRTIYPDNINKNELKSVIQNITSEIRTELAILEKNLDINKKKIKWALSILEKDYAVY